MDYTISFICASLGLSLVNFTMLYFLLLSSVLSTIKTYMLISNCTKIDFTIPQRTAIASLHNRFMVALCLKSALIQAETLVSPPHDI